MMIHTAVRICPHCGKRYTGFGNTPRQAAQDARTCLSLHVRRKHPTPAS